MNKDKTPESSRTGEVQVHKSEWLTPLAGGFVKTCLLAFYYAFYYAILFFTTLFTTLREAPANDLYVFGTFQTASTAYKTACACVSPGGACESCARHADVT